MTLGLVPCKGALDNSRRVVCSWKRWSWRNTECTQLHDVAQGNTQPQHKPQACASAKQLSSHPRTRSGSPAPPSNSGLSASWLKKT